MKTTHYIGLCYIVSIGAAGGVAYFRGKRGFELAKDATLYGGALGTTTIALSFISHIGSGFDGYSTKKQVAKVIAYVDHRYLDPEKFEEHLVQRSRELLLDLWGADELIPE